MKKKWITVLLVLFVLAIGTSVLAGCATSYEGLHIDAPSRVEADLGMYKIPIYNVVDANGAIYSASDYEDLAVKVKSIKDQNNNEVAVPATNSIIVREPGEYEFVYGVAARGVEDAVVIVDFADRTAPTVTLDEDIPDMYIVGNSYAMPLYSFAGDYELSKCYAKLYLADDENGTNLQEVTPEAGDLFEVKAEQKGKYYMLHFHAEDAAGNVNDYKYYRPVDGPAQVKDNTIVYFNDEFGARQVSTQESYYKGSFVTAAEAEEAGVGAIGAMPDEEGYYKLAFSGKDATNHNEGYLSIDTPAISDVRSYTELSFWVYFDPGDTSALPEVSGIDYTTRSALVGTTWWGDTTVPVKTWTKVTFNVQNWSANGNPTDEYNNQILRSNISGFRLRFFWDYEERLLPYGTFYISRLTATPGVVSEIVPNDGRVWPSESTYYIGQTVTLNAEDAKPGETFDCFKVDGQPISGNTFIASEAQHTVEAVYVTGELTPENMTWSTQFEDAKDHLVQAQKEWLGDSVTVKTAGQADYWAVSFDVTGFNSITQDFNVSVYFGNTNLFEFQVKDGAGNYCYYGPGSDWYRSPLSQDITNKFLNVATTPVNILAVRLGDYMYIYIDGEYFYTYNVSALSSGNYYGNYFGYGWRYEIGGGEDTSAEKPTIENAKAVTGEEKARIVFESLSEPVTVTFKDGVTGDKTSYRIGEAVKLNAPQAPDGKVFLRFTANGAPVSGSSYILSKNEAVEFGVEFADAVNVAFSNGAGYTGVLGVGCTVTLKHDAAPAGKVFDYYLVNGIEKVFANSYTLTAETTTIEAVYATVDTMTWQDGSEGITPTEYGLPTGEIESHASNGQTLYILGAADRWAIRETVYGGKTDGDGAQYYFGFMVSSCVLVEFQALSNGNVTIGMAGSGEWTGYVNEPIASRQIYSDIINATEEDPVTFLCVRDGDDLYLYANGEFLLKAQPKFNYSNPFGYGTRNVTTTFPTTVSREFITDTAKLDALMAAQVSTIEAGENVTLDKSSYLLGDTVTLTAAETVEGKLFAYFTVDGERIDGKTFVATKPNHTVEAVYKLLLSVDFTDVTYEGTLVEGGTITLRYAAPEEGKVFDYYLVNGSEKVFENSYTLTAETKTIEAVYVSSASEMTWKEVAYTAPTGSIDSWGAYEKLGSDANWVVTYEVTATNAALSGEITNAWFAGVLVRNNQLVGFEMGDNREHKQFLGSAGSGDGSTWNKLLGEDVRLSEELVTILNGASEQSPVKLIFARQGNKLSVYVEQGGTVYLVVKEKEHAAFAETYGLDFGYGWRTDVGGTPTIQNIRFVTGEGKTQLYLASLTVEITKDENVTLDQTSYTFGDTVTLTAAEAPAGEVFAYFTVDGKEIDGNTFVVEKSKYDVKAVYINLADSYEIVLDEHEESVVTDGEYAIATASVVDGEGSPVEGYTVVAKVTDETGTEYEVKDGKITLTYKGVMKYTVTYSSEGLEGKDVSYTVTLYGSSDGTIVTAGETAAKLIAANGTNATVTADTTQKHGSDTASVKITVNAVIGNQDYAYLPAFDFGDCDYIEFYAYTTAASAQIGAWWYGDMNLTQNEWTYVQLGLNSSNLKDGRWIIRLMGVAAGDSVYISSMKIVRHEGAILDLSKGATKGEWSTEKVYDGADAAVDKTGALKLTPNSGDYYDINATGGVMLRDIRKYSAVYFYVYTETEGAKAGVTWCGDTDLTAGQWTKVTITSDMYGSLEGGAAQQRMELFEFRIMDGNGGTFYITSLYGVR